MKIAVIIPIYSDWPSLGALLPRLAAVATHRSLALELVIVDDGSPEPRPATMTAAPLPVTILRLKRNLGHQRAIACGLTHLSARRDLDAIVVMDGDGEDRPEDIPSLIEALAGADAAVAQRRHRHDGWLFRALHMVFKLGFALSTGHRLDYGNFSALRPIAANRLLDYGELWINFPATLLRAQLRLRRVALDRGQRIAGDGRMGLTALTRHGLAAVAVFAERATTRLTIGAAGLSLLCLAASGVALTMKAAGVTSPGWTTTVVGLSLVLATQFTLVGLVGMLAAFRQPRLPSAIGADEARALIAEIDALGSE